MVRVDLYKQAFRMRTYLAMALMMAIPIIITVAFKTTGGPDEHDEEDFFLMAASSGLNVPLAALSMMSDFLLVVVVALFAGTAVAEEATWGTLRYLLVRPVSRSRLLAAKLAVVCLLSVTATLLITITGLVAGVIAFGWHPVVSPFFEEFSQAYALPRLILATFYVAWCMTGILAFAFMLSTITDAALGAVGGAVGLSIVSHILNAIPALEELRNFLPTYYWHAWDGLFVRPQVTDEMVRGVLLQVPYVFVFLAVAWWWFHRRDIVC